MGRRKIGLNSNFKHGLQYNIDELNVKGRLVKHPTHQNFGNSTSQLHHFGSCRRAPPWETLSAKITIIGLQYKYIVVE